MLATETPAIIAIILVSASGRGKFDDLAATADDPLAQHHFEETTITQAICFFQLDHLDEPIPMDVASASSRGK